MSDRKNSILKQSNDGSSSSFETPREVVKRRVSFSSKRYVQRFDRTDVTIQFDTVTEEMDRTGSSGSPNITRATSCASQQPTISVAPEPSVEAGLNATCQIFDESVGEISYVVDRPMDTPLKNTTCSVFAPVDFSTPRIEVLNDSAGNDDDMEISYYMTPVRTPRRNRSMKNDDTSVMNISSVSPKPLTIEEDAKFDKYDGTPMSIAVTPSKDESLVPTKLSTSRRRLANSYIYRNSPTLAAGGSDEREIPNNVTPYRRRSLSLSRSRRSASFRKSLGDNTSFAVEAISTSPDKENLSNIFDVDEISVLNNCSQSFIKLASPARVCIKPQVPPESPAGNIFAQDNTLDASVAFDKVEEEMNRKEETNTSDTEEKNRFLNESYEVICKNTSKMDGSSNVEKMSDNNSITHQSQTLELVNKTKCSDISGNLSTLHGKSHNATDDHQSFLSIKYSEVVEFQEDQSSTMNKTTSTAIHFDETGHSRDITVVERHTEILPPIEEEEEVPVTNRTVNMDDIVARSEELKLIYAKRVNDLRSSSIDSQGSEIFNETSGFSTDADISVWNQSDLINCSGDVETKNEEPLVDVVKDEYEDVQNDVSMMDVSMKTIGNTSVFVESSNIKKISEGLSILNTVTSITYNDNYKECDVNYQFRLALAFIQSILYNESFRHPMLKDYVVGFEKFAYLKSHMVKNEEPLDLDDLFERVADLKDIDKIIDQFRQINLDVYTNPADQLEVFFDTLYEIYLLLLDHEAVYQKKMIEENYRIGTECSKLLNELVNEKKLYEEDVTRVCEAFKYIDSKYSL